MSIIHEALKKVQANFQKHNAASNGEPSNALQPSDPGNSASKPESPSLIKTIFAVIFLCAALFFGYTQVIRYWADISKTFGIKNVKIQKISLPTLPKPKQPEKAPVPLATVVVTPPSSPVTESENITLANKTPDQNRTNTVLNIQGVMSQGSASVVLINGRIYEEGDEIDGIKILKVSNDNLVILKNGQEETVRVRK